MPRTIVSLNLEDKTWLDAVAKKEHVSMTELVQRAIKAYRQTYQKQTKPNLQELLDKTTNIWQRGNSVEFVRN